MVSFVIVTHSETLAKGICEEAHMMAPDVKIIPAGGTENGELGTSSEKIENAIESVRSCDGVILLCDMGSAVMTCQLVLEDLEGLDEMPVKLADCPTLEGAIQGAVLASSDEDIDSIIAELDSVGTQKKLDM